jgi:hypothetical protein
MRRWYVRTMLARLCFVVVLTLAGCALCLASVASAGAGAPSATQLRAKDPGALLAGNTIVVQTPAARVFGVPKRRNHVAALGAGSTIFGGLRADVLAARAPRVTIRGGAGRDIIHGGRDGTLIGGPGADLVTATRGGATVRAGDGDVVALSGRRDRVVCPPGTSRLLIMRAPGTTVAPACRRGDARVRALAAPAKRPPAARAEVITGDGSNDSPFTAPCDDPGDVDCTVSAFPSRGLSDPWANEYVPAYECPSDHPYLVSKEYAPPFTNWGPGVEIQEDDPVRPINVSITSLKLLQPPLANVFGGTFTGFPNSSATNWLWGGSHWYKVVLHCTSDKCHGTDQVGAPPGCGAGAAQQVAQRRRVSG